MNNISESVATPCSIRSIHLETPMSRRGIRRLQVRLATERVKTTAVSPINHPFIISASVSPFCTWGI